MTKNIIIVVLLIALGALVYVLDPVGFFHEPVVIQTRMDSVIVAKSQIEGIREREAKLVREIESNKLKSRLQKSRYENTIAGLKARIQGRIDNSRHANSLQLDSIRLVIYGQSFGDSLYVMPINQARDMIILKSVQWLNDSLYTATALRVDQLEAEKIRDEEAFKSQILAIKENLSAQEVISRNFEAVNEELRRDKRKEPLRRIRDGLIGGAVGYGLGRLKK